MDGPGEAEDEGHDGEASPKPGKGRSGLVDVLEDDLRVAVPDAGGEQIVFCLLVEDSHLGILRRGGGAKFTPDEGWDCIMLAGVDGVGKLGGVAGEAEIVVSHEGEGGEENEGGGERDETRENLGGG